jgi:hypothetical protein
MKSPHSIPEDILQEITAAECARLNLGPEDCMLFECGAYFPDYCTGCVGYSGPLVVIVWDASPGAVSTYIKRDGRWQHCNSSTW